MNITLARTSRFQTFSGADADPRYTRDDAGYEEAYYTNVHSDLPVLVNVQDEPVRSEQADDDEGQDDGAADDDNTTMK